jgi:TonB-dependent receptor
MEAWFAAKPLCPQGRAFGGHRGFKTMLFQKALLACGAAAAALCAHAPALAQTRSFNLPAQPAFKAIPEFARQARLQIIAPGRDLAGIQTPEVVGELDVRTALGKLLAGTPLRVARDTSQMIILRSTVRTPLGRSERGGVSGSVLDPATGEYLRDATIRLITADGEHRVAASGERGEFALTDVPAGQTQVTVSFTGYPDQSASVTVAPGKTTRLDIQLSRSDADGAVKVGEVVIIASQRDGDARAIMSQRQSMDIKSSLSSESFGDINDGNIGEFLKFMPGVDTENQGGADDTVRYVRLRGLPPQYTSVTVNGISLAATDANEGANTSRAFSFEQVSLGSIDAIEISKTISADVDANAPAGTINLRTKRAFDRKGRRVTVQVGGTSQSDLWDNKSTGPGEHRGGARFRPTGSIEYSNVFFGRRLGVVASVSQSNTHTEFETVQNGWNYTPTTVSPDAMATATLLGRLTSQELSRFASSVTLDFRATDKLIVSMAAMYNRAYNWSSQRSYTFTSGARSRGVIGDAAFDFTSNQLAATNTVSVASNVIAKRGTGLTLIPSFEYRDDRFLLDGNLSYSDSTSRYDPLDDKGAIFGLVNAPTAKGNYSASRSRDVLRYDWTVSQVSGPDWSDAGSYGVTALTINARDGRSSRLERTGGAVNLTVNLPIRQAEVSLKTGLKFQRNDYEYDNQREAYQYTYVGPLTVAQFLAANRSQTPLSFNESGFAYASLSGSRDLYMPSNELIGALFLNHPDQFSRSFTATNYYNAYIANSRRFEEDANAAYAMATARFADRLTLRAGLRWEETRTASLEFDPKTADELRAAGYAVNASTGRAMTIEGLQYQYQTRTKRKGRYDHLFPSASLKFTVDANTDLQVGYSRTIQRPEVNVLAGVWSVNDVDRIVTAPNPGLEPAFSDNLSVRLARYFEPVGLVAVNYFQNRIKGLFESQDLTAEEFGYTGTEYADYLFRTTTTVGGEAINIHGVELEFNYALDRLPQPFKGLTLRGSYTYTKPDMPISLTAKNMATLALAYKRGPVRLNFNAVWADDRPGTLSSGTYDKARLDANLSGGYQLASGWQAFFAVRNLFDTAKYRMAPGRTNAGGTIPDHGANYNNAGVSGTLGVRATF